MPKREAYGHRKMKALARELGISRAHAHGIMCVIWHNVAPDQCPDGSIGRLSDEEIAEEVDWTADASVLIDAMVTTGWLDKSRKYRLIIHDWDEHCEDTVHRKLVRAGKTFANSKIPSFSRLNIEERNAAEKRFSNLNPCARQAHGERTASARSAPYPSLPNLTLPNPTEPEAYDARGDAPKKGLPEDFSQNLSRNGTGKGVKMPTKARLDKLVNSIKRAKGGLVPSGVLAAYETLIGPGPPSEKEIALTRLGDWAKECGVRA